MGLTYQTGLVRKGEQAGNRPDPRAGPSRAAGVGLWISTFRSRRNGYVSGPPPPFSSLRFLFAAVGLRSRQNFPRRRGCARRYVAFCCRLRTNPNLEGSIYPLSPFVNPFFQFPRVWKSIRKELSKGTQSALGIELALGNRQNRSPSSFGPVLAASSRMWSRPSRGERTATGTGFSCSRSEEILSSRALLRG